MKQIVFTFNKKCNWNCDYCNQKLLDKSIEKSDEDLIIDFKKWLSFSLKYNDYLSLYLCGGEPGLWSENLWEEITKIIDSFSSKIVFLGVFTNGTTFVNNFFNKDSYNRIQHLWHCTPYIKDTIVQLPFLDGRRFLLGTNVIPMIVLQKSEIQYLEKFIIDNPKLGQFYIDLAQNSKYTKGVEDFTVEDYEEVIKIIRKFPHRISTETLMSINATKNRLKAEGISSIQKICSKQNHMVLIDLAEDNIYRCCNYSSSVKLTEENLKLKFSNKLFLNEECGNCVNKVAYYGVVQYNA